MLRPGEPQLEFQNSEQPGRQQRIAVLTTFALLHPNLHPGPVDSARVLRLTGLLSRSPAPYTVIRNARVFRMGTTHRKELFRLPRPLNTCGRRMARLLEG